MPSKKRILIIGAGLCGLSAAYHLKKLRIESALFEKESEVGGLSRSKEINGFIFDYDGHLLHFRNNYTFQLVRSLLGKNLKKHKRNAWIYSCGRLIRYPFQANLHGLPYNILQECLIGIFSANQNQKKNRGKSKNITFWEWIHDTFGDGIAKHFMLPYNTKFWTVSPKELTCDWFDGFIPVPTLKQLFRGLIYDNNRGELGYNAKFWYPRQGGIEKVAQAFSRNIQNVYTSCPITYIDYSKKEIEIASQRKEKFDYLISTIPLPELANLIKIDIPEIKAAFKKLRWNSIFNLNLGIDKIDEDRHWIYFPQDDISFFRIGFFHNFSSSLAPSNRSSLYIEVSYSKDKPINKRTIINRIKKDLLNLGIIKENSNIYCQTVFDIKYGYPIYDMNYKEARKKILDFLRKHNIISCGRYGGWSYLSMEDVILEGRKAAKFLSYK